MKLVQLVIYGKCIIGVEITRIKTHEKKQIEELVVDHLRLKLHCRAGGELGRKAAIVPCCQTLGPPNEEKSILGHMDNQSFEEIYHGKEYNKLRRAHEQKKFDEIDYCKNCDFLYEDPEVMVWTNDKNAKVNHMLGTPEDFILTNYTSQKRD